MRVEPRGCGGRRLRVRVSVLRLRYIYFRTAKAWPICCAAHNRSQSIRLAMFLIQLSRVMESLRKFWRNRMRKSRGICQMLSATAPIKMFACSPHFCSHNCSRQASICIRVQIGFGMLSWLFVNTIMYLFAIDFARWYSVNSITSLILARTTLTMMMASFGD